MAGVLAFSVSARMREFGVRLAIGSTPSNLLTRILSEGAVIAAVGIVAGVIGGFALLRFAGGFFGNIEVPGACAARRCGAGVDLCRSRGVVDARRSRITRRRDAGVTVGVAGTGIGIRDPRSRIRWQCASEQ